MKRIIVFLLLLLVVSGCGGTTNNEKEQPTDTDTQIPPTATYTEAPNSTYTPEPTFTPSYTPIPDGYVMIPDVIGMKRGEAYDILEELGLVPLTFWVMHDEYGYGYVTDIEPRVGEVVQVNSEVALHVVGEVAKPGGGGDGCPTGTTLRNEAKGLCHALFPCSDISPGKDPNALYAYCKVKWPPPTYHSYIWDPSWTNCGCIVNK